MPQPFEVTIDSFEGIPPPGDGTFTFTAAGGYTLTLELVDNLGRRLWPGGLLSTVQGEAQNTRSPSLAFFPSHLGRMSPSAAGNLLREAQRMSADAQRRIPDYTPLAPGTLRAYAAPFVLSLADSQHKATRRYSKVLEESGWFGASATERDLTRFRDEAATAAAGNWVNLGWNLGAGPTVGRVYVVLGDDDFELLRPTTEDSGASAFAASGKVIFIRADRLHFTAAHEFVHTLPYLWSSTQMAAECGRDYHNGDSNVARGMQITFLGGEQRERQGVEASYMEGGSWTDQCTYWNLLDEFTKQQADPPVMLVQGRIAQRRQRTFGGELLPLYTFDGIPTLAEGSGGDWAIELYDATGTRLARYPFVVEWKVADLDVMRRIDSFVHVIPQHVAAAELRLVGPRGTLAKKALTGAPPTVRITSPLDSGSVSGRLTLVQWTASDPEAKRLRFSVLYSSDGGQTWLPQQLDITATHATVQLDGSTSRHLVKVLATDGTSSHSDTVEFSTSGS